MSRLSRRRVPRRASPLGRRLILDPLDVDARKVDGYIPAGRAIELRERYLLEESNNPNVWLCLVDEPWPFLEHVSAAPVTAVAFDLLDSTDERTRRAGRELLEALDRPSHSA